MVPDKQNPQLAKVSGRERGGGKGGITKEMWI